MENSFHYNPREVFKLALGCRCQWSLSLHTGRSGFKNISSCSCSCLQWPSASYGENNRQWCCGSRHFSLCFPKSRLGWTVGGIWNEARYWYIPVHTIAAHLGPAKSSALPAFHALTGCDTTSSFFGKGKKLPRQCGMPFLNLLCRWYSYPVQTQAPRCWRHTHLYFSSS